MEKHGLPFLFEKAMLYKSFLIGLSLCVAFLYQASLRIWFVEPCGNESLSDTELFCLLEHYGFRLGMPQSKVVSKELGTFLRNQKEELTWVSCRKDGTILTIDMKENDGYRKDTSTQIPEHDFLAFADGEIVKIVTKKGMPLVKKGDLVQKNQVLISSQVPYLDESGNVKECIDVDTQGEIWIRHMENNSFQVDKQTNTREEDESSRILQSIKTERRVMEKILKSLNDLQKKEVEIVRKNVTIRRNSEIITVELDTEVIEGVRKYE